MQRLSKWVCFTVVPLLAAGCGGKEPAATASPELPAVSARTARVEVVTQPGLFSATGTVQSATITTVGARVMGQIVAVSAEEGQRVQRGQLLVRIDDRDAQAQVAQAEAALALARAMEGELDRGIQAADSGRAAAAAQAELATATFERFQQLLDRKSVSLQEFDEVAARHRGAQSQLRQAEETLASMEARRPQIAAGIQQAEAALEAARNLLSYSAVSAPFTGVVSAKHVEPGQMSAPGMPLVTIEESRRFEVHATVDERRLGLVGRGAAVRVELGALGTTVEGKVEEIVPRADPVSRSFTVKIALPEDTAGLKSGLFANVIFPGPEQTVMVAPSGAVVRRGQLVGVFVVDDGGKARFRLVKTGRDEQGRVEVLSGLAEGETVVVSPGPQLQDGSPVNPVSAQLPSRTLTQDIDGEAA